MFAGNSLMKLRRRSSAGSRSSSAASASIARSIAYVASGRPAPRYAPVGVVFVTTALASKLIFGIRYTAWLISCVSIGRTTPIIG